MHRIVFTDGACSPNPGIGGWGSVILHGETEQPLYYLSGGIHDTTNNEMELMAIVSSVASTPIGAYVDVVTDSKYAVTNFEKWLLQWAKYGWKTKSGSKVKNIDLWKYLFKLSCHRSVHLHWVKGHDGNMFNEMADQLAVRARMLVEADGQHYPDNIAFDMFDSLSMYEAVGSVVIGKGKVFMEDLNLFLHEAEGLDGEPPGMDFDLGSAGGDKTVVKKNYFPQMKASGQLFSNATSKAFIKAMKEVTPVLPKSLFEGMPKEVSDTIKFNKDSHE